MDPDPAQVDPNDPNKRPKLSVKHVSRKALPIGGFKGEAAFDEPDNPDAPSQHALRAQRMRLEQGERKFQVGAVENVLPPEVAAHNKPPGEREKTTVIVDAQAMRSGQGPSFSKIKIEQTSSNLDKNAN